MRHPTKRQIEILDYILGYRVATGIAPSLVDIARHFQFNVNAAKTHIVAMEKKGMIHTIEGIRRSITIPMVKKR